MTPQLTEKDPKLKLLDGSVEKARFALESARAYYLTLISNVKKQELESLGIMLSFVVHLTLKSEMTVSCQ